MQRIPEVVVNLKLYEETSRGRAVELARAAEKLSSETEVLIGLAPNPLDLWKVVEEVDIPVFTQHVDAVPVGAHTGHLSPYLLKEYGVAGSILNHSERRIGLNEISWTIGVLSEQGLVSIVCAVSPREALAAASLGPTSVALEPPELIGTGISVSRAKPDAITRAVSLVRNAHPSVKILCGAGITDSGDVERALELGADGVLLASAVARHMSPERKLRELVEGVVKARRPRSGP